ncbi:hypothetical protein [Wolbachia endosymbiont of Trichogramma pretiosum]|uniref:hypothetical protein n=1 Tax=Wolbachia endosymbiont of Trichogramma pretiosum TaxID=125593 RepID=UPI000AFC871D|nr:hypothetical protein [Wolbachia endosymbiont of Trichogramma pretiosum]OCA05692.1 hypothetical protein wTpre_10 [Wolbachia endosymbiont of Trichogramma pretiosum]
MFKKLIMRLYKELAQLSHLTLLDLSCGYVGTEGAKILASGNLINLIRFKVYDNSINYIGSQTLASGSLVRLTSIILIIVILIARSLKISCLHCKVGVIKEK